MLIGTLVKARQRNLLGESARSLSSPHLYLCFMRNYFICMLFRGTLPKLGDLFAYLKRYRVLHLK